jgi:hypothetical protein
MSSSDCSTRSSGSSFRLRVQIIHRPGCLCTARCAAQRRRRRRIHTGNPHPLPQARRRCAHPCPHALWKTGATRAQWCGDRALAGVADAVDGAGDDGGPVAGAWAARPASSVAWCTSAAGRAGELAGGHAAQHAAHATRSREAPADLPRGGLARRGAVDEQDHSRWRGRLRRLPPAWLSGRAAPLGPGRPAATEAARPLDRRGDHGNGAGESAAPVRRPFLSSNCDANMVAENFLICYTVLTLG